MRIGCKKANECPKSPLTTLNLNFLKTESRIAKPNTYLKPRGLHNFLISHMTLQQVLLKIFKQNKFTNAGFCSIRSLFQLQKFLFSATLMFCFICILQGNFFPQNAVHCCWSLYSVFCRKSTERPLWTFSIAGLITSMLAVDLPVFCLPLWGEVHPAQYQFSKTCHPTTSRMACFWGLAIFAIQVKVFHKLCRSEWNWSCFGVKRNHLNPLFYTIFLVVNHLGTFYTI